MTHQNLQQMLQVRTAEDDTTAEPAGLARVNIGHTMRYAKLSLTRLKKLGRE
jgi:hypothetical protein